MITITTRPETQSVAVKYKLSGVELLRLQTKQDSRNKLKQSLAVIFKL